MRLGTSEYLGRYWVVRETHKAGRLGASSLKAGEAHVLLASGGTLLGPEALEATRKGRFK